MLTPRDLNRYDRQIRLIGREGQERLKRSKVFIAGAGGLGSPISIYLAAAGVGSIVIVDRDTVELSNLNRQILHWDRDVGGAKAASAREKLNLINGDIEIEALVETIDEENAIDLVGDADLIIDAMDNFPTRYMMNRAAVQKGIPFVHGAIRGFQGQATTVLPGRTPCLRCIFPSAPPSETFPVIGTTPGIIGTIQALEAIKYITGMGDLLAGRLLIWDGLNMELEILDLQRSPDCPECSESAGGL